MVDVLVRLLLCAKNGVEIESFLEEVWTQLNPL